METFKKWIADIIGYIVVLVIKYFPDTCEEWTQVFGFLIGFFTLFFITLPKVYTVIKGWFKKEG